MNHDLKIKREYWDAKIEGLKMFEIRQNNRGFEVGDTVSYTVIDEDGAKEEKVWPMFGICYITDFQQKPGYVVFGEELIT